MAVLREQTPAPGLHQLVLPRVVSNPIRPRLTWVLLIPSQSLTLAESDISNYGLGRSDPVKYSKPRQELLTY